MTAIEKALHILKDNGYKLTDKREDLLRTVSEESRYMTAKEVQERIQNKYPSISQDTVYRNLHTFVQLSLLEETEWNGEKWFRFRCSVDQHHHHFICTTCGDSKELTMCPMNFFEDQLPDCAIASHRFEIFGTCAKCLSLAS